MNDRKDDDGVGIAEKTMDAVGGVIGKASAATMGSVSAGSFVESASIGDRYEIEAGRLALERSRSPEIRHAAQMLIADHVTSSHQLKSALRMSEAQVEPPQELDSRRRGMIEHLVEAKDDQFDAVWLDQQKLAHSETVSLFEGFSKHGGDPQLRSYASAMLPGLKLHRDHIERLAG